MDETPLLEQPVSMLMTTGDLITVEPDDDLASVWEIFEDGRISHVPVLEKGVKLVGVLSLVDLLKLHTAHSAREGAVGEAAVDSGGNYEEAVPMNEFPLEQRKVREVMTRNLETIRPTSTLRHAARLFASGDFHSLLVTATDGELLGILTSSDVIRSLLGDVPRE